jgi:hypothetical protein
MRTSRLPVDELAAHPVPVGLLAGRIRSGTDGSLRSLRRRLLPHRRIDRCRTTAK